MSGESLEADVLAHEIGAQGRGQLIDVNVNLAMFGGEAAAEVVMAYAGGGDIKTAMQLAKDVRLGGS